MMGTGRENGKSTTKTKTKAVAVEGRQIQIVSHTQ